MAAPVVAGTVALMIQANPKLTPNLVEGDHRVHGAGRTNYDALTQGAGFLNTKGAVDLAKFLEGAAGRLALPEQPGVEQADPVGQSQAHEGRHQAGGQRLGAEHGVGRDRRR